MVNLFLIYFKKKLDIFIFINFVIIFKGNLQFLKFKLYFLKSINI